MFIDYERTRLCTPSGVRCLAAAIAKALALVIRTHRTPNGVREPLFVIGAINIALLTECKHRLPLFGSLKLCQKTRS